MEGRHIAVLLSLKFLFINICIYVFVLDSSEGLEYSFKNNFCSFAWDCHPYLFSDTFFASIKNISVWKCL